MLRIRAQPTLILNGQLLGKLTAGPGQNGKIFFDDVNLEKRKFKPMEVVKQFQQCNDAFLLSLAEKYRDESLKVYCYNPGLVDTNIHKSWPFPFSFIMHKIAKPLFMKQPEKAAEKPLEIISNPSGHNSVLVNSKGKGIKPSKTLMDKNYRNKVIHLSNFLISSQL